MGWTRTSPGRAFIITGLHFSMQNNPFLLLSFVCACMWCVRVGDEITSRRESNEKLRVHLFLSYLVLLQANHSSSSFLSSVLGDVTTRWCVFRRSSSHSSYSFRPSISTYPYQEWLLAMPASLFFLPLPELATPSFHNSWCFSWNLVL